MYSCNVFESAPQNPLMGPLLIGLPLTQTCLVSTKLLKAKFRECTGCNATHLVSFWQPEYFLHLDSSNFFEPKRIQSLKTCPLKMRLGPKRKRESIPTIHFQVLWLLVSGRVVSIGNRKSHLIWVPKRSCGSNFHLSLRISCHHLN